MAKVVTKSMSSDDAMADLRRQLESAKERCTWLEQSKQSEYNARIEAERKIGKFQSEVADAFGKARVNAAERDDAMRKLSFAQGYIAALKGEPYEPQETYGERSGTSVFPSMLQRDR